jgi:hypothetical protein
MAAWALSKLLPMAAFAELVARNSASETDPAVREEWIA